MPSVQEGTLVNRVDLDQPSTLFALTTENFIKHGTNKNEAHGPQRSSELLL